MIQCYYTLCLNIMNILCSNKKATFKYTLVKKLEAGIALEGWEVKSIKAGHGQISESYVSVLDNEVYLINAHLKVLPNYSNSDNLNPTRKRKLLLSKREIQQIIDEIKMRGLAIFPIKIYTKKSLIKVEIAVGKGKKIVDKRNDIKTKEWNRKKQRLLKSNSSS